MKIVDISLRYMIDVVATCIVLHNMCIIGNDKFDIKWIKEAERELNRHIDNSLLRQKLRVELAAIDEIRNINIIENSARRIEEVDKDTKNFLIKKMRKMKIYCWKLQKCI